MANYNLETETTVHVKGMSFGESSGGESSMVGGNSLVINDTNSRIGYYETKDGGSIKIIDSDDMFILTGTSKFSFIQPLLSLIEALYGLGIDVSSYIEKLEYNGLSPYFFEQYLDAKEESLYLSLDDVVSVSNYNEWDDPVSTGFLPYYVAFGYIEMGDTRPFDEVVAEVSAEMESKIDWSSQLSGTTFHFIIPHVNGDGLINLFRVLANAAQSASYSARPMNLFSR